MLALRGVGDLQTEVGLGVMVGRGFIGGFTFLELGETGSINGG